jgi:diguanylate cyclase
MTLTTAWLRLAGPLLGTLKLRITLAMMVALTLGIGASTVILVQRAERDTLAAVRERELEEAVRAATTLSRRVVELQQALRLTADRLDPETLADPGRLRQFFEAQPVLRDLFGAIAMINTNGQLRMMSNREGIFQPTLDLSDRPYFRRCLAERRPIISEALPSRINGSVLIVFAQPVVRGGEVHGVLTGMLNLNKRDLLAELVDRHTADDEVLRVVTDAQGHILAHPNRSMVLSPLAAEPRLAQAAARWQRSGSPVEPAGLMLAQQDVVVSASGVADTDWVVWRAVDEQRLLGPLHAARRQALAWAAALVALTSAAMLAGLWWLLKPLRQLQQRARHLFDTRHDPAQGWPLAGGEIGTLASLLKRVSVERALMERRNHELLNKLGSVMGNAPVGIAFTRAKHFELVSSEFCRLVGHSEAELLGQPARIIYDSLDDYEALGPKVAAAFAAGEAYVDDVPMRHANGSRFWAHLRGRPVAAGDSEAGTIWTVTDVTAEVAARAQLEWSANHDRLTGLANRQAFEQRLARCFEAPSSALPSALVMIDLDRFKPVNDAAGHAAGDAMLQQVAGALRARLRTRDMAARLGGDEFALLLEHCPLEAAMGVAEDVRSAITALELAWGDHRLRVGASLGVAALAPDMQSMAAWLHAADEACYAAKAAGRNTVRAAPPGRPALRVVATG